MVAYLLSALGVIVVAGLFTAWVIYEMKKPDDSHKKSYDHTKMRKS
ncbi:MAG: hypothetical protein K0R14_385 [Burkholderiales bacterium]|nr:hypothetical protein [Burkholderiales bacterium]